MKKMTKGEEDSDVERKYCLTCGVTSIDSMSIKEFNKISAAIVFNEETFECLFCPTNINIMEDQFFRNIGLSFANLCDLFKIYLSNSYNRRILNLVYSFLICNEGKIKGGCGYEKRNANERFKLYINPYFCNKNDDLRKTFAIVMGTAMHEIVHVFLHTIDPIKYHVTNNYHGEEFFQIFDELRVTFFDKDELIKSFWEN